MPHDPTIEIAAQLNLLRAMILHIGSEANDEWTESHSWDGVPNGLHTNYRAWLEEVDHRMGTWSEELLVLAHLRPKPKG